ncbi:hypothetical protein HK103_003881 [Boothiomyces macroporosus]|uniref:Transcription initiation factor TFIID subunit 12 domain-containing protein n=1 Tax=Boothiomyces macroporosus TaxID=261099 RepID=A0AAD5UR61_9FUNG|nr:hypothetical protein HK103_003881 [Boothiomyces macroporosus]
MQSDEVNSPRIPQAIISAIAQIPGAPRPGHPSYQAYVQAFQANLMSQRQSSINSRNNLISKDRIKQLLRRIDPEQRLDGDVEDVLLDLTGEFIKSVTKTASMLCKHRQGEALEAHDAQMIVEKNYNIRVPGFGVEEVQERKKKQKNEVHVQKVAVVREAARKAGVVKRSSRLRARQIKQ